MDKLQQDNSLENNNNEPIPTSDKSETDGILKDNDTVEIEEESQGYRLIIHQIDSSKHNKLNPCSKLPEQIRREQFISICADIWHRHLDEVRKEREITKEENFNDNS